MQNWLAKLLGKIIQCPADDNCGKFEARLIGMTQKLGLRFGDFILETPFCHLTRKGMEAGADG